MFASKSIQTAVLAAVLTTSLVAGTNAHAIEYLSTTGSTVGTGALVYYIVQLNNRVSEAEKKSAEKAAAVYLQENAVQVAEGINLGRGVFIDELATAMKIRPEHKKELSRVLRTHRTELLELAKVEKLSPARAGLFIRTIGVRVQANAVLAADLAVARGS